MNFPFSPQRFPLFYGWVILAAGIVGTVASVPGQTIGVGVFKESLLFTLKISEVKLSLAYMIGTATSSLILPFAGRILDRVGARPMAVVTTIAMGISLFIFSQAGRVVECNPFPVSDSVYAVVVMSIIYLMIRFFGQGCMTLIPRVMIGKWFNHRRGLAAGILGVFMSFGFGISPKILDVLVGKPEGSGWVITLIGLALLIGLGVSLLSWLLYRDNPESCGLAPDGVRDPEWHKRMQEKFPDVHREFTRKEAVFTISFWAFSLGLSSMSLVLTAVTFHIATIAENQGTTRDIVYNMFIPTAAVSVIANFSGAWLSDRIKLKWLLLVMMTCQALGMLGTMHVADFAGRLMYIIGMGISGGLFAALITVVWPRYFGRLHLGAISGLNLMMIVMGSAIGPWLFSAAQAQTGSYIQVIQFCLAIPALVFIMGLFAENPQRKWAP
ncbi:MAG: MFS transporter [Candidatus Sumerlaeota bacterium]